jgi:sortase A
MKNKISTGLLLFILLLGLSLLLYPTVSDYWNSLHQSRAIAAYVEQAANLDNEEYQRILEQAEQYNQELYERGSTLELNDEERAEYNSTLSFSGDGLMGYIEIPSIDVSLPIYHGSEEKVLQEGVGHLEGSSLPVGGESSHCVLVGHRGLPTAKLFSDLDQLKEGDVFTITILDETLTYEVDQIRIVEPQEVDDLAIEEGADYCTLVTCTPYGINSHRLLVRGRRIDNAGYLGAFRVTADALQIDVIYVVPFAATPLLVVMVVWVLVRTGKTKYKRKINTYRKDGMDL